MTCENQPIAEMLVPYVEGALAEAERLEVSDHLRHCPACREEARLLRDGILGLRNVFSAGYRPSLARHPEPEDLAGFSLEPGMLSEDQVQGLQIHLLECDDCAAEVALLRDMHKDLEGRVAVGGAPLVLPRALREEVERVYPAGRPLPRPQDTSPALPLLDRIAFMLSRFNWRPLLATGLAAVVVTLGFLFVLGDGGREVAMQPASVPAAAPPPATGTSALPPAEVALMVAPGQADQAARALDREKIPYENRDGRLYLSPSDLQRARQVVDRPDSDLAMADPTVSPASPPEPGPATPEPKTETAPAADAEAGKVAGQPKDTAAQATPSGSSRSEPAPAAPAVRVPQDPPRPAAQPRPASAASIPAPAPPRATPTPRPSGPVLAHSQAPAGGGEAAPAPRPVAMRDVALRTESSGRAASGGAAAESSADFEAAPPTPLAAGARRDAPVATAPPPETVAMAEATKSMNRSAGNLGLPQAAAPAPSRAVALEPRARQVAGDASVSVEEGEDGSVRVLVRTRRALTAQEEDELRLRLRRELNLRDSDTISIRRS